MRGAMKWMGLGAIGFLVLLLWNTARLSADVRPALPPPAPDIDTAAVRHLVEAVRIPSVSLTSPGGDPSHFLALHALMRQQFPHVFSELEVETVSEHSLLLTWKGLEPQQPPIVLLGHVDVVPVEPGTAEQWTHPPFSGAAVGGFVWGRGTLDDKASVWAQLEAVERLLGVGFQPRQTIYFGFGHDEETGGQRGAIEIASRLADRGVNAAFTLDEGSAITHGLMSGVDAPVASVMLGEKGYVSLRLTATAEGGHSSTPPTETAIGRLSRALARVDANPFPARIIEPVGTMLEQLAPHMSWLNRFFIANRWMFQPLMLDSLTSNRTTNALVRTTTAPTMLRAGIKDNVLPTAATAVINFRILPGDSTDSVREQLARIIDDEAILIEPIDGFGSNPPAVSSADTVGFNRIRRAIHAVFPEVIVASGIILATTDNRHYAAVREQGYYFVPFTYTPDDATRIHGTDERISVTGYLRMIEFYESLLRGDPAPAPL